MLSINLGRPIVGVLIVVRVRWPRGRDWNIYEKTNVYCEKIAYTT